MNLTISKNLYYSKVPFNAENETTKSKINNSIDVLDVVVPAVVLPAVFFVENGTKDFNKRNVPKFLLALTAVAIPIIYLNKLINKRFFSENEDKKTNIGKIAYVTLSGAVLFPALMKLVEVTKLDKPIDSTKNLSSNSEIVRFFRKKPYISSAIMGAGLGLITSLYRSSTEKKTKTF